MESIVVVQFHLLCLIYALIQTLNDKENTSPEIVSVAFAILSLLFLSSLAAFPLIRHLHHNFFKRIHHFVGWIALALLWIFITLTVSYDPKTKSYNNAKICSKLIKQQEFLFKLAITVLIIIPWITVRHVPVKVTSPSGHATIIKFEAGVKAGILGRISPSPLSEWMRLGSFLMGRQST
ncbi:adenylate-forming reductase 06235-like [Solanum pennellii]|uniref:Adenylate-forming reductase 06235-like n=1 Tax=Solanum pennellii TaxID=28526 RepID=A0ABM1G3K4_SOLPN|nr:adenylate-forming reductase 06235-like [Solanum pennellii]